MTRDDIIRMAREAGFMVVSEGEPETGAWYECFTEEIERFAALVAARALEGSYDEMIALVRAAEREACAKVCEEWGAWNNVAADCAAAIRARGGKT